MAKSTRSHDILRIALQCAKLHAKESDKKAMDLINLACVAKLNDNLDTNKIVSSVPNSTHPVVKYALKACVADYEYNKLIYEWGGTRDIWGYSLAAIKLSHRIDQANTVLLIGEYVDILEMFDQVNL